jgi:hypothetical protein
VPLGRRSIDLSVLRRTHDNDARQEGIKMSVEIELPSAPSSAVEY